MNTRTRTISAVSLSPEKLKDRREALNLSQREVAEKAGVPTSTIGRLETGERDNPTVDVAARIAKALKCKVDDLLK